MFDPKEILGKADYQTKELLADLLADMMLNDENVPEDQKVEVRIFKAYREFDKKFAHFVNEITEPILDHAECEAAYPQRKEALEYIQLMTAGLDSFLATHAPGSTVDSAGG